MKLSLNKSKLKKLSQDSALDKNQTLHVAGATGYCSTMCGCHTGGHQDQCEQK
ncbi:hypothetical protein [Pseudoalteromonas rubra]|uniref:hypothetical protein n=1 Tax=Pseudoalteromonas rubra TaxID=43658 RepID=UPI0014862B31|nr:hypothetical protein [Pseudoalteromonas rubra]